MAICRNAILNLLHVWGYASLKFARERFSLNPRQALGLKVVAEGVETREDIVWFSDSGNDRIVKYRLVWD